MSLCFLLLRRANLKQHSKNIVWTSSNERDIPSMWVWINGNIMNQRWLVLVVHCQCHQLFAKNTGWWWSRLIMVGMIDNGQWGPIVVKNKALLMVDSQFGIVHLMVNWNVKNEMSNWWLLHVLRMVDNCWWRIVSDQQATTRWERGWRVTHA